MKPSSNRISIANRWLLTVNGLLLIGLLAMVLTSDRFKTFAHLEPEAGPHPVAVNFRNNPAYEAQLPFIQHQPQATIVMLGTSLTANTDWKDWLNRCDVLNQGIHGDVTSGMAARVEWVMAKNPKICFIETGTNDLSYAIPEVTALEQLNRLVTALQQAQITPVLHTVTKVTTFHKNKRFNAQATAFNQQLRYYAAAQNLTLIDLDRATDSAGFFKASFAAPDGIHYSYDLYQLWAKEIQNVLRKEGI